MSVGDRDPENDDTPASVSAVVRVLQKNAGLRAHLSSPPRIDRTWRVPYLGGSSIDGSTVYIDNQTPTVFQKSNVEPDKYYAIHEMTEWWLMTMRGVDYDPTRGLGAHPLAHGMEHYFMRLDGIDDDRIEEYERESMALVNIDEHLKLPPEAFPPDLYLGPYDDEDDQRLITLLRQAQFVTR